jgi:hypothetical protein
MAAKHIRHAIWRGDALTTPADAREAVRIATEGLEGLPRARRHVFLMVALHLPLILAYGVIGDSVLAFAYAGLVVLFLLALPVLGRTVRGRLQRAVEANSALAREPGYSPGGWRAS